MAELNKILYVVVVEDEDDGGKRENGKGRSDSFRYTRAVLQSTLQLMGCKPRHAFKISKRVFGILTSQSSRDATSRMRMNVADSSNVGPKVRESSSNANHVVKAKEGTGLVLQSDSGSKNLSSELYKRRTTVSIGRAKFLDVVCDALAEYKYVGPNQRADLVLACRLRERKESVTVLLCGTSGCGKSTLSSLLASRLGITTVVSTDSIRHMMRSFVDEKQNKLLWASTYHAGECLDPVAVAESKARRQARKKARMSHSISKDKLSDIALNEKSENQKPEVVSNSTEQISPKRMAIEGFKAQSEMVIESLDRLITTWEARKESVIIEGVHLSLNFVLIQRKGSSRHLMALVDDKGYVTKAWPVDRGGSNDKPAADSGMGTPMYGPLQIGKAEPVNLHFGHFGLSAWPNDTGSASYASSFDESRTDCTGTETGSRCYSSCCSSPRMSEGHAKQLKEELSVSVSDEEGDDPPEADSDDDISDQHTHEEIDGGSVDECSIKSDEEYDDLAMQDDQENGYAYDDDEESGARPILSSSSLSEFLHSNSKRADIYPPTLDMFLRTQSDPFREQNGQLCSPLVEKGDKKMPRSVHLRTFKRSLSIPVTRRDKHPNDPTDP
ncbi:hypothetical protein Cgig2_014293 [Carnegiea gigantea]|uniref:Uncharacterized protein n=1 Tax=Carnegiea gigantea TaxID=171969 RepID=A0A9Q1Q7S3_9CARY|nr:hypothetical protein Cgig2_014293 [Carnegiea gigantea]